VSIVARIFAEFNPKGVQDASDSFEKFGKKVAGALSIGTIVKFSSEFIKAAAEDEGAQRRLQTQLENTTGATADQVEQVERFIEKTQMSKGVLDDQLRPALGNLVRATEDVTEAQELLELAIDISIGTGRDLEAVSIALARAEDGNTTALRKLGIQTKDTEGETLSFQEVLKKLSTTFGGQADKALETTEGKMRLLEIQMEETKETIGAALIPIFLDVVDALTPILTTFQALPDPIQQTVVFTSTFAGIFVAASQALEGFGLSAGKANVALGLLGVSLGLAIVIYGNYNRRKEEAIQRTNSLAKALDQEAGAQQESIQELVRSDKNIRRLVETTTAFGLTLGDLEEFYKSGTGELAKLLEVVDEYGNQSSTTDGEGRMLAHGFGLTEKEVEKLFGSYANLSRNIHTVTTESERLRKEFIDTEASTKLIKEATGELALSQEEAAQKAKLDEEAQEELRKELEEQERALKGVIDAQLAAFSSQIGLEQATFNTADAIHGFNVLLAEAHFGLYEGTDIFRDYAVAENEVLEATLRQAAAAAKLAEDNAKASGATLTAAQSAIIQRDELNKVAQTLDPSSPLRKQLMEYVTELNTQIPKEVRTSLKIASDTDIETRRFLNLGKRAFGGPVRASTPYIVGERGPELFIPQTPGNVVSNADLLRTPSASSLVSGAVGGGNTTVNVYMPAGANGDDVVRALQQWSRSNGALPLATTTSIRR